MKMTCACSRRKYEMVNDGTHKREDVSLHCTDDGNYEDLQCDNGLCWCVEPTTGKPNQRAYPESLMIYLPCYNKKYIGLQYLRRCESKTVAVAKLIKKVKFHGHNYVHLDNVMCDDDGSYGSYQIDRRIVRCTWKDGKQIDNYQTDNVNNIKQVNCNCARDSFIYSEANFQFRLNCQPNGNYDPFQNTNGHPFCVDQDGFATSKDLGNIGEILKCKG